MKTTARMKGLPVESLPVVANLHNGAIGYDVCPCLNDRSLLQFWSLQHARKLSITEVFRLQGFDVKQMTIPILSDKHRGRLIGETFTCTVLARVMACAIQASRGIPATGSGTEDTIEDPKYHYHTGYLKKRSETWPSHDTAKRRKAEPATMCQPQAERGCQDVRPLAARSDAGRFHPPAASAVPATRLAAC